MLFLKKKKRKLNVKKSKKQRSANFNWKRKKKKVTGTVLLPFKSDKKIYKKTQIRNVIIYYSYANLWINNKIRE